MNAREKVKNTYADAYAAKDIDGFWHIWTPKHRGALNDARQPTRSAENAWESAAIRLQHNSTKNR